MIKTAVDRRQFLASASMVGLGTAMGLPALSSFQARGQEMWKPERPIQVVIQFAAGGGTDTVIRGLLKEMEPKLGQPINATNMTGALGSVATRHVLSQPADGYTWLGAGGFLDYPRIRGIDTAITWQDFQFFQAASSIASWSTHPDSQFRTFQDVIDYAKANPGKLRVSTDGIGGLWHEAMALVSSRAGFDFTNVPYDGGAPATLAALQKEVDVAGSGLHEQIQFVRSGQLRHLATFTKEPVDIGGGVMLEPVTKYVPDAAEVAPFGADYNLALRRDTPLAVLQTVAAALTEAVQSEGFKKMLTERFMEPVVLIGEAVDEKAARLETVRAGLFAELGLAEKTAEELGLPKPDGFGDWWPPEGYKPAL